MEAEADSGIVGGVSEVLCAGLQVAEKDGFYIIYVQLTFNIIYDIYIYFWG